MFFITQEICITCINKDRFYIMLFDVARVGFLYVEQVLIRYFLFIFPVSFFDIGLQFVNRCMQVDQYFGEDELLVNDVEQFLVQPELFIRQIHFCKQ